MRILLPLLLAVSLTVPCLSDVLFQPGDLLESWSLNEEKSSKINSDGYQVLNLNGPKGEKISVGIQSTAVQENIKKTLEADKNFSMGSLRLPDRKGWFARCKYRDEEKRLLNKYVFYLDTKATKTAQTWVYGVYLSKSTSLKKLKEVLASIKILD